MPRTLERAERPIREFLDAASRLRDMYRASATRRVHEQPPVRYLVEPFLQRIELLFDARVVTSDGASGGPDVADPAHGTEGPELIESCSEERHQRDWWRLGGRDEGR